MWETQLERAAAFAVLSEVGDGDFRVDAEPEGLERARREFVGLPWVWLTQVHGAGVVRVTDEASAQAAQGAEGDALVTTMTDTVVSVRAADCGPIALVSPQGVVGAVHAGWRGLVAGVIPAAAAAMRDLGAREIFGALFSCIGPECYEFGPAELALVREQLGDAVVGRTAGGSVALDVPAAVSASMALAGVEEVAVGRGCTACDPGARWYSHRARREVGRHALAVWMAPITYPLDVQDH